MSRSAITLIFLTVYMSLSCFGFMTWLKRPEGHSPEDSILGHVIWVAVTLFLLMALSKWTTRKKLPS